MLYRQEKFKFRKVILCIQTRWSAHNGPCDQDALVGKGGKFSLSKTTKLILFDSLLKEVCISSDLDRLLTFECLCFSVTNTLFRANESLLNKYKF